MTDGSGLPNREQNTPATDSHIESEKWFSLLSQTKIVVGTNVQLQNIYLVQGDFGPSVLAG